MSIDPDWDGVMKQKAREPKIPAPTVITSLSRDGHVRHIEQAIRAVLSESMVAMLNLPLMAEKLYQLGIRAR